MNLRYNFNFKSNKTYRYNEKPRRSRGFQEFKYACTTKSQYAIVIYIISLVITRDSVGLLLVTYLIALHILTFKTDLPDFSTSYSRWTISPD